jgi:AraC-like DNA-binding protein
MKHGFEKVSRFHYQLSETRPIMAYCVHHPRREGPAWDMHYGLEFGLVWSGKQRRLFFDKSEREVQAGDVWFCRMWEPHGMKVVTAPCEVMVMQIWPPFLAQMHFPEAPDFSALAPFNAPPKQRPAVSGKTRASMMKFGRQLKDILSAGTYHRPLKLRFVLQEILLCICESWPKAAAWGRLNPPAEFARINPAIHLVFDRRAFVSTAEAARVCGMNRHKFAALFQSWMNIRFADFSLRHRLQQTAAQLRENTSAPIKEIIRPWGFTDESHFHRVFRKLFGLSPGQYRRR